MTNRTCFSAKTEGVYKEFQKTVKANVCYYVPERGVLVLLSRDDMSQRRANMIQEMYFRNLSQKVSIAQFYFDPERCANHKVS